VLVLAAAGGGYLEYVAVRHAQPVTLPAPTGKYKVGRAMFDWTDRSRIDPLAPRPGRPRELSVWLWYPAPHDAEGRQAPYAPGAWGQLHFPGVVGLGETSFGAVRDHALAGAPVAGGRFPIAVLEPGLGLAAPQYTTVAENLASHGYLVAGVTPTYSANLTVLHGRAVHETAAGNPPRLNADLHSAAARRTGDRLVGVWAADARFAAAGWPGSPAASPGTWTRHAPRTSGTPSAVPRPWKPAVPTRTARRRWTSTARSSAGWCGPGCGYR
jgi:predicted dienelactone hydrolase